MFPRDTQGRLRLAAYFVTLAILVIYVYDQVWPSIDVVGGEWVFRKTIPTMRPVGIDFFLGVYRPATFLRGGQSPYTLGNWYPPLVALLGLPYTFMTLQNAYRVHAVLLMVANVATLWLSMAIAVAVFGLSTPLLPRDARGLAQTMMAQMAFFVFTSYPLHFSIERGNSDIYAQLFSVAALYLLLKRSRSVWLQVLLISLAVHIKVYPAILFCLVFWRYRWKSLLPIGAINGALLFILGWRPAFQFFHDVHGTMFAKTSWLGNHSAVSFSKMILAAHGYSEPNASRALILLTVAMWSIGAVVLWRRKFTPMNAVLLFALSVPVMHIVPPVSHDYKIVILNAPLAIMLFACIARFVAEGTWRPVIASAAMLVIAGGLSRSYADVTTPWLTNKCPWILALQAVFLVAVIVPGVVARGRASTAPGRSIPLREAEADTAAEVAR